MSVMNKKMAVSMATGLVISGAAMYFSFRNIPFSDLVAYLKNIKYAWILPSVILIFLSFCARVARWRILAKPVAVLGFREAFDMTMTGFMLNCVLPARIGEIVRPAALKKKYGVPFTAGLATVVVERILDMIFLIIFLAICLNTVNISPDINFAYNQLAINKSTLESVATGMEKLLVLLVIGMLAVCFEKTRNLISSFIHALPNLLWFAGSDSKNFVRKIVVKPVDATLHNIASGFEAIKKTGHLIMCLSYSLLVWVLIILSYYTFALGCPGVDLSLLEISAVMVIISFIIALPSVPGYWGIWEAGSIFAVTIFGVNMENAAGYSLVNHAVQIFPVIIIGFFSAISLGFGSGFINEAETLAEDN